jgi:uncharacterized cupredoxin-like copper-binding protein
LASVTTFLASAPKGAIAVSMAGPPPHYVPATFTARSGDVTLFVTNGSHAAHDIAIDREPLQYSADRVTNLPLAVSSLIDVGTSAAFVVKRVPAGTYYFWCTIDGHATEGMTGTFTVRP